MALHVTVADLPLPAAAPHYNVADLGSRDRGTVRCVNSTPQVRKGGGAWRMARNYRTTDPQRIMAQLAEAGFTVTRATNLFSHSCSDYGGPSPWRYGIEAVYPHTSPAITSYVDRARLLLAHNGRQALQIGLGALRFECTNQFIGSVIHIRHTDPEIDYFVADPAAVLMSMRGACGNTVRQVESLRGRDWPPELLSALRPAPRLHTAVSNALPDYPDGPNRFSAWSLVQALTSVRSPRTIKAASVLLQRPELFDSDAGEATGAMDAYRTIFSRN